MMVTLVAGIAAVELVDVAAATLAAGHVAAEDYLLLAGALALVLVASAGVKIALDLRARYWIVLVAVIVLLVPMIGLLSVFYEAWERLLSVFLS